MEPMGKLHQKVSAVEEFLAEGRRGCKDQDGPELLPPSLGQKQVNERGFLGPPTEALEQKGETHGGE